MEHIHNDVLRQRLADTERERDEARSGVDGLRVAVEGLMVTLDNTERERDRLAGENLRLTAERAKLTRQVLAERKHIAELDQMLAHRVEQYLGLKLVVALRDELGPPVPTAPVLTLVDCRGTLPVTEAAEQLGIPADELLTFLVKTNYLAVCGCHGYCLPESQLDDFKTLFIEWTVEQFKADLKLDD